MKMNVLMFRVALVFKVPPALPERKVSEDPEESLVLLDPSGRLERE